MNQTPLMANERENMTEDATEPELAAAWRESLGLSQQKLGELLGYSKAAIYWMERGLTAPRPGLKSKKVDPAVWKRYKRACAGLDAEARSQQVFVWESYVDPVETAAMARRTARNSTT